MPIFQAYLSQLFLPHHQLCFHLNAHLDRHLVYPFVIARNMSVAYLKTLSMSTFG
jgi:hypothetical protein